MHIQHAHHSHLALSLALLLSLTGCRDATPQAPQEASLLTVTSVQAQTRNWPQMVQANGIIQAWQEIIVSPETGGLRLTELRVDIGASVKQGELLARLADDSIRAELRMQEATVAQAQAAYEQASANQRRAMATAHSGALSEQQVEEYRINEKTAQASLKAAEAERDTTRLKLSQTRITALDDGIVASKTAVLGEAVNTGSELYRLIRRGVLEWQAEVDAHQLTSIAKGNTALIELPDGSQAQGKVRLSAPVLNDSTGRATVYITLDPGSARQGMFAKGQILSGSKEALTLPASTITRRDGRDYVWLLQQDEHVTSQMVQTGRQMGNRIEILSGISAEDHVVMSGGAFLSEHAKVTVEPSASPAEPLTPDHTGDGA